MDRISNQSKIDCKEEYAKGIPSAQKLSMEAFESCYKKSNHPIHLPLLKPGVNEDSTASKPATYPANHPYTELFMAARKSSASVKTSENRRGTAFFISADGDMATDYHVVKDHGFVSVKTVDGKTRRAIVMATDPANDTAVLKVQKLHADEKFQPLSIAPFQLAKAEGKYLACGFGGREELHCSPGKYQGSMLQRDVNLVDHVPYMDPNRQLIALRQHTKRGDSGGMIFDLKTRKVTLLIGMTDSSASTLATPAQRLIELHSVMNKKLH